MKRTRVTKHFSSVAMAPQGCNRSLARAVSGVLMAAGMLPGAPALAQQVQMEAKRPLEEIIVTARYRDERLQEIPIAITAIDAEEIEMRAFTVASDVAYAVPNASFRPAQAAYGNTMTAFIRGIGQYDFDFAFEPGVAIYIDDMYHPFTLGSQTQLMDIDHVEVLRGPQGTLFGRGSIGGAIRYVSKKPQGDDSGSIGLTIGDYDRVDLRASYDFAITDSVAARVTGVSTSRDGYQDVLDFTCVHPELSNGLPTQPVNKGTGCKTGTQGGADYIGGRGMLRWEANDDFEILLTADYQKETAEPKADTVTNINPGSPGPPATGGFLWSGAFANAFLGTSYPTYDERFLPPNPFETYATYSDARSGLAFKPETEYESWSTSVRADWGITEGVDMAVILAYADITSTLVSDADGSPINVQSTHGVQTIDYYTAELRFSGRAFDRMDWTVGGFYYDGESINNQIVSIPFLGFVANVPPVSFEDPSTPFVNTDNVHDSTNESVFAHLVFDVTEKLALTAGVRYSNDEKDVRFDNTRVQDVNVVVEGDNTDYKLGIDYQFTSDILAYASWSTGYRPGSYNPRPFQATQVVAVDAEDSEAYELGVKSDWFDRRLRTNLAVFYTDWKTRITPVGGTECLLLDPGPPPVYQQDNPNTPGSVTDSLGNVCEATTSRTFYENTPGEIEGIEVEVSWEPIDGLLFSGLYGWIDWESPDINDNPAVVTERPPYVPEDNWALSASYAWALGSGASLTPRMDYYGQAEICSQTVFTFSTFPGASCTDAYELLNVRLEWRSPEDKWTVAVGATNVTDEEYFYNKFDLTAFGQPHAEGQPGHPREWYVTLGRNF
jgi:iron complex outermembrane recepter protein